MARPAAGKSLVACIALALVGLALALLATACGGGPATDGPGGGGGGKADDLRDDLPTRVPTRVILLIGDGMGLGQMSGGAFASGEPLAIFSMPELGFFTTHEHEFVTTDSAASASAIASGVKTHFGAVGVTPGTRRDEEGDEEHQLRTVVDVARDNGWRTGLIATTSVVDATPAAFAAHRASRKSKNEIALDLRNSGVDILMGGGTRYFEARPDKVNLLSQMSSAGYSVARTATGLRRITSGGKTRVVALLAEDEMPEAGARAMELPEMTAQALEILDNADPDGFFLMVEGSQIDRMSHDLDGPATVAEMRDFDAAVEVALDYARGRDDTLVVVTADHETGGLTILDPAAAAPYIDELGGAEAAIDKAAFPNGSGPPPFADLDVGEGQLGPPAGAARLTTAYGYLSLASRPFFRGLTDFFQGTHTPSMVAAFAEGPGADYAASSRDNAELGSRLRAMIAAAGQGGERDETRQEGTPKSVILVLTDELGLSGWTATHYATGPLAATGLPVAGLQATWGHDRLLPDRGAAATGIAGGAPTLPGAVGMIPGTDGELVAVETLLERAAASGKRTGIVTTAALSDPALAAFYAHLEGASPADRADRLVDAGVDVVFGGGSDDFAADDLDRWREHGATVETGWSEVTGSLEGGRVRLVTGGELAPARTRLAGGDQPTLEEMTRAAIDLLDGDTDGMFLVVYAGGPAARGAALDRDGLLIDEVVDLDRAVQAAVEAATARGDTAVVVTSLRGSSLSVLDNHYGFHKGECGVEKSCGGPEDFPDLSVATDRVPSGDGLDDDELQDGFSPVRLHLQFAWLVQAARAGGLGDPASADLVPLFATGPGTAALEGFGTAFSLGQQLAAWLAE